MMSTWRCFRPLAKSLVPAAGLLRKPTIATTRLLSSQAGSGTRKSRLFVMAGGIGICVGGAYAAFSGILGQGNAGNLKQTANEGKPEDFLLNELPPEFTPARIVTVPGDTSGLKITLFQYQTCPFCCKARAFLDYYGLNYSVIEVNSVTRKQVLYNSVDVFSIETH
jgi:microsomal prostaglandin-E synthase 2